MLTPFMRMQGTFISNADVIGTAEYIDLAVANVNSIPFAMRELRVSAVREVIFGDGSRSVPSRSDT